jgi:hypothetical protein
MIFFTDCKELIIFYAPGSGRDGDLLGDGLHESAAPVTGYNSEVMKTHGYQSCDQLR